MNCNIIKQNADVYNLLWSKIQADVISLSKVNKSSFVWRLVGICDVGFKYLKNDILQEHENFQKTFK